MSERNFVKWSVAEESSEAMLELVERLRQEKVPMYQAIAGHDAFWSEEFPGMISPITLYELNQLLDSGDITPISALMIAMRDPEAELACEFPTEVCVAEADTSNLR